MFRRIISCLVLSLTIFTPLSSMGSETQAHENAVTLRFKAFHDPGYLYFSDKEGKEVEAGFFYRFITFEMVDTWEAGEEFLLFINPDIGVGIKRIVDGTIYKAIFASDNPIDRAEASCLSKAISTLDISGCYYESRSHWLREIDFLMNELRRSSSESLVSELSAAEQSWQGYETDLMNSFYIHAEEQGGSIKKIQAAALQSELMKSRYKQLLSFFE